MGVVAVSVGLELFTNVDLDNPSIGWIVLLQTPIWVAFLGGMRFARRFNLNWRHQLAWRIRRSDIALGLGVGVALQVVVNLMYWGILTLFDGADADDVAEPARELAENVVSPLEILALVLLAVVMAPLVEELLFRGLIQGAISDKFGHLLGVGASSVLFGLSHFQGIQLPALILVGIANGLLVWKTKRIGPAFWSHLSFNGVTTLILTL